MARLTKEKKLEKQSQGRQLYASGFSIIDIANIIGVTQKTLRSWSEKDKWEEERELASLKPSTMKRLTLKCALAIQNGEPLPYKADDISKIVAAFDRVTDSRKKAVYTMESFDQFTNFLLGLAGKQKPAEQQSTLELIKTIRPFFDKYITKLLMDD
jgi:hypothetical protein